MRNSPEGESISQNPLRHMRGAIGAAALAILIAAGCKTERAGAHIEIIDPAANVELEKLRRKFVEATQRTRYNKAEEKTARIAGILSERDKLLKSKGIPPQTETWYESGSSSEGPTMAIEVDTRACISAPTCTVKPSDSDFPKVPEASED